LRWISPGRFLMGSPESEAKRFDDEGPQHWVTITRGFWLFDTACTQALWTAVMPKNPSHFRESRLLPVDSISWSDCVAFLERINGLVAGLDLRLPTEAEWEYACRAGTETPFSFGETITSEQVNSNGGFPYRGGPGGQYRKKTVPVASFPPNPWGLYEMHGNLWEWCATACGPMEKTPSRIP
jgi:formylglycine-generating enzyme required for sulfatase activity